MENGRGVIMTKIFIVSDSIVDPFQTSFYDSYNIEVSNNSSNPNQIMITNYANLKNTQNIPLTIIAQVSGTSINIASQLILGPSSEATVDYIQVDESSGYYSNDSIYFNLSYSDRYDPYYGDCWGKKN
ncbi:MAG: hypothetical protein JKX68_08010 [Flavobacteriales bacterium]|nr:hypothetical protein [Flavobacteriales bacterium]